MRLFHSFLPLLFGCMLAGLITAEPASAAAQAPEMRAIWASRFEWPSANQATAKANIDQIMTRIQANNFNTVFFQVRGQCDVHYPSPYEPWSNTYNWTNPGWDPLAYAIEAAHSRGIEFHAYINTHALAGPVPPSSTTPQHPYNLHGPTVPIPDSWMIRTSPTGGAGAVDSYYWISPGVPEASWWTRRAVMHVVQNYDVDGVHFDRIRTPASIYSHDAISEARFAGDGNPDSLAWADFMRSQITRDLRHIYGEIQLHKPHVKVSAAPFGIMYKDATTLYQGTGTQAYHEWYQDGWGWMNSHVVDFMVPQIYWEVGSAHPFELLLADWRSHTDGRHIVAGSTTGAGSKTVSALLAEHAETRTQGVAGHCIFSYGSMGAYWSPFLTGPYDTPTTVPLMPWKTNPTTGFIVGYVRDGMGVPILDSKINRADDSYNYLSAYDGFYAIVDVAPGTTHTVTASKSGLSRTVRNVAILAGQTTVVNINLTTGTGTISFDAGIYGGSDTAVVTAADGDLMGAGEIAVRVRSNTETNDEVVSLTETATPGVFSGTVDFAVGTANNGDGIVQVSDGDTVTATYSDAENNDGYSADTTATATINDAPPVISDVQANSITPYGATITFTTDRPTTGLVRYGTSCAALTSSTASPAQGAAHSVPLTDLAPETTYYYRVEAQDQSGHLVVADNGGACFSFTTAVEPAGYYEDFDDGGGGWTGTGLWHLVNTGDSCADSHSAPAAWYYGTASCTYNTGATNSGTLTSPQFVVPADGQLKFFSREQTQGVYALDDTRKVYVIPDGGSPTLLHQSVNNANAWYQPAPIDMSAYVGQLVSLQFEFNTVNDTSNDYAGWYVDDVSVAPPGMTVSPTAHEYRLRQGGSAAHSMVVANTAATGSIDWRVGDEIGSIAGGIIPSGTSIYRGNVFEATRNTTLLSIEPHLQFTGTATINYVVYESATFNGTNNYTRILSQTATRTGTGAGLYPSNPISVPLVAGRYYIVAAGWSAAIGYGYDTVLFPRPVSFGQIRQGFGYSGYPAGTAMSKGTSANTYYQRLVTGAPWLTCTPGSGTLVAGSGQAASLEASAASLTPGRYTSAFGVSASDYTVTPSSIDVTLWVASADFLTEIFDQADNDLADSAICVIPNESVSSYSLCRTTAAAFPVDPSGGTPLALGNDSFAQISLADGKQVVLYGAAYNSIFVGSNGHLTFGAGDSSAVQTAEAHFSLPRVAALTTDLDPGAGGTVSWKQLSDRVAVTYESIPRAGVGGANSFQIEMFFDGTIRVTWLGLSATEGIAGISAGGGMPLDFAESDLSGWGACTPPAAPVLLSATPVSDNDIDLLWTDTSSNEAAFKIERNDGADFTQIGTAPMGATAYPDTGMPKNSYHTYRVRSSNIFGDSDPSGVMGATTLPVRLSTWDIE